MGVDGLHLEKGGQQSKKEQKIEIYDPERYSLIIVCRHVQTLQRKVRGKE
jgi:hypothetical protein